jgi:hypothetical protein
MAAQNSFKGKFNEGLFSNGQGPIHGVEIKREEETKGQLNPATSGRHLSTVGGASDGLDGRSEEKGFDIHGAGYKGPQNWTPKNMGDVPNFNVNGGK